MTYTLLNNPPMDTPAQKIAQAIDIAMKGFDGGKGISQSALARGCGVPQPTINRTLKGKSIPETATLSKIIQFLGPDKVILDQSVTAIIGTYKIDGGETPKRHYVSDAAKEPPARIRLIIDQLMAIDVNSPVIDAIELLLSAASLSNDTKAKNTRQRKKSFIDPEQSLSELAKQAGIDTKTGETRKTGH